MTPLDASAPAGPATTVEYARIRTSYQTLRFTVAVGIALGLLAAVAIRDGEFAVSALFVVPACLHAAWSRVHSTSAFATAVIDTATVGAFFIVEGVFPTTVPAVLGYFATVGLLVLTRTQTAVLAALAVAIAAVVALVDPLARQVSAAGTRETLDLFFAMAFIIGTVGLLAITNGSLRRMQRQHEEALTAERRAVELKNEFVSMVSHELRTPLTSITGFNDTLRDSWRDLEDPEIDEFLAIMRQEADHLATIVEDILVIPRLEAGRLPMEIEPVGLRNAASEVVEALFPPGEEIEVNLAIPAGISVLADRGRLRQVMRNLLDNARKYGGDQVLVDGDDLGDHYEIVVSDNGPGVPEVDRDRIFDHFEQLTKGDARSDSGFGLGLPIARKLVGAMGGELWYEQRFPTGARFCFTLPLVERRDETSAPIRELRVRDRI